MSTKAKRVSTSINVHSAFALGVNQVFFDLDAQIRDLDVTIERYDEERRYLEDDLRSLQERNSKRATLEKEIEEMRKKNSTLKDRLIRITGELGEYDTADHAVAQIEAVKDKEIRRLRNMVETGTLDVGVFVKSHKAHQKEAENQENLRKRSEQSLVFARAEVAELEGRLEELGKQMSEERQEPYQCITPATELLQLQRVLIRLVNAKLQQEQDLMALDETLENKQKRVEQLAAIRSNDERHAQMVILERGRLENVRKKARELGIPIPQTEEEAINSDDDSDDDNKKGFDFGEKDEVGIEAMSVSSSIISNGAINTDGK
ncbi:MAG: hypothetical protein EZS28_013965 [Streblomastix strix]|uniref:Uncharacterized protein n=1 Tax=Streblomastix strix TaxID=222440 RepID=A0A5J4W705_9EUKA|nr:MAG: hypothetical protein EZS28_013965 [Streblomastix strix]